MQSEFTLLAVSPPGLNDPSVAIAASRAGAIGILDLEYCLRPESAVRAFRRLARFGKNSFGIKLSGFPEDFTYRVVELLAGQLSTVILTDGNPSFLQHLVTSLHEGRTKVLLEIVSVDQARIAHSANADGLIAKGNEAGGRVGDETAFVLLQRVLSATSLPVWAHGGIGLHTAAACKAAGAAGVVLDAQLALTRESALPVMAKNCISRMDGSETVSLGQNLGSPYRVYMQPGFPIVDELRHIENNLCQTHPASNVSAQWRNELASRVGWGPPGEHLWLIGQDTAFAADLANRFQTVGSVIDGIRRAIDGHLQSASVLNPLDEDCALARSIGTRFPILQGPMTRVSDNARFAAAVACAGALPFLALALMRAPDIRNLLDETRQLLGHRPWGVGILGFVPVDLREEQLEAILQSRPPFALIAGGRPDQVSTLEHVGIRTYVHVPSPGLLELFLESGARRFVFEGRECGGHVGPRSSFVLWNTMIDTLVNGAPGADLSDYHVIFAGGIHDAVSAAMVASMAAPLAERHASLGVLMGTAYLFTREAVATGAIVKHFQDEAIQCSRTVLLETGPGHATRCADTPFVELFRLEKQKLTARKAAPDQIRDTLESLNLGRLRIASKGIVRHSRYGQDLHSPKLASCSEQEQHAAGMYMIGQVAALRNQVCDMDDLHRDVAVHGTELVRNLGSHAALAVRTSPKEHPCDLAIVGMSCRLPKAPDLQTYWDNILNKVNAVREIPAERWDWRLYFHSNPAERDKIYSKWGGFLDDMEFDPLFYGIPPSVINSIEPLQLLALELVRSALEDAGYRDRCLPNQRASVILGAGGGIADLGSKYAVRAWLPALIGEVPSDVLSRLPEWTEDSFPGILLNVVAGRIANRFDLGGVNFTVDAACASSLAALYVASKELETHSSDVVIVGGVDTVQNPFGYLCFSKTHALSPKGSCRPFDQNADGIAISEGLAAIVLKRLDDAEANGDQVYAVLKGIAGSSDGRAKGLTAPSADGQVTALKRAYTKAGFSPATVGLIEAHGTGTVAGDQAELHALKHVLDEAGAPRQGCALGSVKSMIGHTKCAAGLAGIIKVALALHQKILPPTINVDRPNPNASKEGPLYVNTELRPWMSDSDHPRRAAVSSFGFGGTNFHAVLEEYTDGFMEEDRGRLPHQRTSEILVWRAASARALDEELHILEKALDLRLGLNLCDLAYTLWQGASKSKLNDESDAVALTLVATSLDDVRQKLRSLRSRLSQGSQEIRDPSGVYFRKGTRTDSPLVAFLFPGQGSQYPGMLRELVVEFPEVRAAFERADTILRPRFAQLLTSFVFPPPTFTTDEEEANRKALTATNVAQPALAAAESGLLCVLRNLGVECDFAAGHSFGEYVALHCADVFDEDTLYRISEARGRFIVEQSDSDSGSMAAVTGDPAAVAETLRAVDGVWVANRNTPSQTVISGNRKGMTEAVSRLAERGFTVQPVPTACGFHSPLVARARHSLAELLSSIEFTPPRLKVFSNTTGDLYASDPSSIKEVLANHLTQPVEFAHEIRTIYHHGARVFVEIGPRKVLTGLTDQILGDWPHLAIACDWPERSGVLQLHHVLAHLLHEGVHVKLDRLYQGRQLSELDISRLTTMPIPGPRSGVWLVNGSGARPLHSSTPTNATAVETDLGGGAKQTTNQPTQIPARISVPRATDPEHSAISSSANGRQVNHEHSTDDTLVRLQRIMKKFLLTQQTMLTYLKGSTLDARHSTDHAIAQVAASIDSVPRVSSAASTHAQSLSNTSAPALEPAPRQVLPESATPPVSKQPEPPPFSPDMVWLTLRRIVSERTGYPEDSLDLDADIAADLGVDSIKKVEIIGSLQKECIPGRRLASNVVEKLTGVKTLRAMVDISTDALVPIASPREAPPCTLDVEAARPPQPSELPRFLLQQTEQANWGHVSLPRDRTFLITDDQSGIAASVAEKLRKLGVQVALLTAGAEAGEIAPGSYVANLTHPESLRQTVEMVRKRQGCIVGLIHLLPLKRTDAADHAAPVQLVEQVELRVKSLLSLVQALATDIRKTDSTVPSGWLVVATWTGTAVGVGARMLLPVDGGIAGLLKSVAQEWPQVRCKVLNLGAVPDPEQFASQLVNEMTGCDNEVQIEYAGNRRLAMRPEAAPLGRHNLCGASLDSNSVLLLTGGARGITAEVALEIAEKYRPILLLVGRSPLPEPDEAPRTAGVADRTDLIRVLFAADQEAGQPVSSVAAQRRADRILQAREIRSTLAAIKEAGASVHYYQVDVCDWDRVTELVAHIYETYGRLDGVIHGAGIIEDKLIEAKTLESFDRVFSPKVRGALALVHALRPDSLQFLAFFSSVAGKFGNRGQADYAAANDYLNELARYLDSIWKARVVALNWGPWDGAGMVSLAIARSFQSRGVELVPARAGRIAFDAELLYGTKGQSEVILGGGPWERARTAGTAEKRQVAMIKMLRPGSVGGALEFTHDLTVGDHFYLDDHRLDGIPVLPATIAVELVAEIAAMGWPNWEIAGVRSLQVLKGIVFLNDEARIRTVATPAPGIDMSSDAAEIHVEIFSGKAAHASYKGVALLRKALPDAPKFVHGAESASSIDIGAGEAYRSLLFHGPRFHCLRDTLKVEAAGCVAAVQLSRPSDCLARPLAHSWILDPIVLDAAPQLAIVWARTNRGVTALPSEVDSVLRFRQTHTPTELRCHLRVRETFSDHLMSADADFTDHNDRVFLSVRGLHATCSDQLNRLGGARRVA
jgi:acyl transferase domain-containing protein/NAD(P)H-dependent flavin oxidoreductase YrpB (nitropropane dioxygenase family)/NAD(P)-dependent dehydrogenase (short-subunit alcohol dehydrogenase family)